MNIVRYVYYPIPKKNSRWRPPRDLQEFAREVPKLHTRITFYPYHRISVAMLHNIREVPRTIGKKIIFNLVQFGHTVNRFLSYRSISKVGDNDRYALIFTESVERFNLRSLALELYVFVGNFVICGQSSDATNDFMT